jgi:hypothetical protein
LPLVMPSLLILAAASVVTGMAVVLAVRGLLPALACMLFARAWKHAMRADGGILEMVSQSWAASAEGKLSSAHFSGTCTMLILAPGRYSLVVLVWHFLSINCLYSLACFQNWACTSLLFLCGQCQN